MKKKKKTWVHLLPALSPLGSLSRVAHSTRNTDSPAPSRDTVVKKMEKGGSRAFGRQPSEYSKGFQGWALPYPPDGSQSTDSRNLVRVPEGQIFGKK